MIVLCRLAEIEDGGARGFSFADESGQRDVFVVRRGREVFGYVNSCPHIGTPLEFLPDRFLTADGTQILCSTHGARFAIATGECLAGPCRGKALTPFSVRVVEDAIVCDAATFHRAVIS